MAEDLSPQLTQKNTQSEQELQLKKRARRRLVGAIALVLAMVVILPMILDDRSTKPQAPITISIPDEDNTEFTSNIVPLPPVDVAPESQTNTAAQPNSVVQPGDAAENKSAIDNTNIANSPAKTPSTVVKNVNASTDNDVTNQPQVTKPDAVKVEPAAEKSALSNAKSNHIANTTVNKSGNFAVQIGVFSNAEAVKELQVKLLADGVKTHTETIKTDKGDKIRLRTSQYNSREAAIEALNSIKLAGVAGGMVVAE